MRLPIVIFVVTVHLAAIVLLCNVGDGRAAPTSPQPADETSGGNGSNPGDQPDKNADATAARKQTDRPRRAAGPASFQRVPAALPPQLVRKTAGCKTGAVVDWDRRRILWGKDEHRAVPIASLTKMMTALLTQEAVNAKPSVTLATRVQVTPSAAKVGGSQVYLDPRESFSIDELLKCIMIFSANDAAHLLAEFLAEGKVDTFVKRMNARAKELGLNSLVFLTPHGLPEPGNRKENKGSALDLAWLAGHLLQYPRIVKWSSTWVAYIRENTDKRFQLVNRNRLVKTCPGVNGMKTGFTQDAGFCIAATCKRDGRTVVVVVTGCASAKQRNALVVDLLDWAYQHPGS